LQFKGRREIENSTIYFESKEKMFKLSFVFAVIEKGNWLYRKLEIIVQIRARFQDMGDWSNYN